MMMFGFFLVFLSLMFFFIGLFFMNMFTMYMFFFELFCFFDLVIDLSFLLDWMSMIYLSVICYISGAVFLFSSVYLEKEYSVQFGMLLFSFVLSMILLVVSGDLFVMFLGWDGLGVTSFLLVIFYQNYRCLNSGMITFIMNRIGDIFMIFGLGVIMLSGSSSFMMMDDNKMLGLLMLFVFLGGLTKSAQFPFSAWLPAAMAAPTPVSALVHSSTLVTAGVYMICRFSMFGYFNMFYYLMVISLFTVLMSSLMACFEYDVKKIIALSTLSQLGLMMFTISIGLWKLSFYHMITHAMFKSMLFLCGGSVIYFLHHKQDMRFYMVSLQSSFVVKVGFVVSLLCLIGFPFLSGFYSKDLIIEMFLMEKMNLFVVIMFLFSMMLTVVYSLRLLFFLYNVCMMNLSLEGFYESMKINVSIILLLIWGLFSGVVMQYILLDVGEFVFLDKLKVIGVFVLLLGSFFLLIFMNMYNYVWGNFQKMLSDFFFLFSLSGNINLKMLDFMLWYSFVDESWMEKSGPMMFINILSFMSLMKEKIFNMSLMMMVGVLLMVVLLF